MTNLTDTEFKILGSIIEEDVKEKWHETRGRKNQVSGKDAFFMLLVVLKYYSSWDKHALDFKFKTPTFERLITRMMDVVEPILTEKLIRQCTMTSLRNAEKQFTNFPEAIYATDVKFQPAHRPGGSFMDVKRYFSGKHKMYGYKIEASVSPAGAYVMMSTHRPGSVSDMSIFLERVAIVVTTRCTVTAMEVAFFTNDGLFLFEP
ncbi:hypothetical protein LEN26_002681 [Aphanomyces euteiches]|nr:hypothetical protein AeMF1_013716 [Aphanomyces euteiches]KAH9158849.1 hypothetical protein LEN26_002681 [Aphanomyces euteiches]